jgi:uncharacterized protein YoxC
MLPEPMLLPIALAQAAGALPDTVVLRQAASGGFLWWVELFASIATIVIALAILLVALAIIPAAWYARKIYGVIDEVLRRMRQDAQPIVKHAEGAMDNVHYVTAAVRGDIERVQRIIDDAQTRLNRSTTQAEHRIREFNALLKVMQEEAEDLFVGTASAMRGVQAGTARLTHSETGAVEADDIRVVRRENPNA